MNDIESTLERRLRAAGFSRAEYEQTVGDDDAEVGAGVYLGFTATQSSVPRHGEFFSLSNGKLIAKLQRSLDITGIMHVVEGDKLLVAGAPGYTPRIHGLEHEILEQPDGSSYCLLPAEAVITDETLAVVSDGKNLVALDRELAVVELYSVPDTRVRTGLSDEQLSQVRELLSVSVDTWLYDEVDEWLAGALPSSQVWALGAIQRYGPNEMGEEAMSAVKELLDSLRSESSERVRFIIHDSSAELYDDVREARFSLEESQWVSPNELHALCERREHIEVYVQTLLLAEQKRARASLEALDREGDALMDVADVSRYDWHNEQLRRAVLDGTMGWWVRFAESNLERELP